MPIWPGLHGPLSSLRQPRRAAHGDRGRGIGRLEAELIAGRDAAGAEASARLEALGRAYVNFAVSCPGYFRVMFHGDAKSSGPTASGLRAFHLLRDAVLACQEAGTAPAGDPGPLCLRPGRRFTASPPCGPTGPCRLRVCSQNAWGRNSGVSSLACSPLSLALRHETEKSRLDRADVRAASWRGRTLCARRDRAFQTAWLVEPPGAWQRRRGRKRWRRASIK